MATVTTLKQEPVRCLLLSTQARFTLVLPHDCVAEIVASHKLVPVESSPSWLLGAVEWRGEMLPLIAMERLSGEGQYDFPKKVPFVVIKRLTSAEKAQFYAIAIHGIPHFQTIDEKNITEVPGQMPAYLAYQLIFGKESGYVPDIEALEKLLDRELPELPKPGL